MYKYTINFQVLNSRFANGVISVPSSPTTSESGPPTRRIIFVDEDFELFHLVLYFLYTSRICFVTTPEVEPNSDIPTTCDAEGIYSLSQRLMVDSLEKKALHFLQATCDLENISKRTFGRFAADHEEVGKWYDRYFISHWNEVRKGEEFERVFVELENDHEEYIRVNTKFRALIKDRD